MSLDTFTDVERDDRVYIKSTSDKWYRKNTGYEGMSGVVLSVDKDVTTRDDGVLLVDYFAIIWLDIGKEVKVPGDAIHRVIEPPHVRKRKELINQAHEIVLADEIDNDAVLAIHPELVKHIDPHDSFWARWLWYVDQAGGLE